MKHGRWYYFIKDHATRAKMFGLTESFTEQEWIDLLESSGHKCMCCKGSFDKLTASADHVIPLSCGGKGTIDNIQVLCLQCNRNKNARAIDYRHGGEPILLSVTPRKPRGKKKTKFVPDKTEKLRLPVELYTFLEEHAKKHKRSVNSEMLLALEEWLAKIEKEQGDQAQS